MIFLFWIVVGVYIWSYKGEDSDKDIVLKSGNETNSTLDVFTCI